MSPGHLAIPSPPSRLITGHLADFRADRLGFFIHCAQTYGDVVGLRILHRRMLLFSRPDLIEQVLVGQAKNFVKHFGLLMYKPLLGNGLVTSEGDFWRRQRKLAAPAFQAGRLPGYANAMDSSTRAMIESWRRNGGEGAGVRDVHADMMRLTLEVACRTLFGADACPEPELVGRAMEEGLYAIGARFERLVPVPDWLPVPSNLRLRRSLRTMDRVIGTVIGRRREALDHDAKAAASAPGEPPVEAHDLLSILLRARDDNGAPMSEVQLQDEARTLFLAGHETTALALSYSLYLLATHPDAQAEVQSELSSALSGRPPAYEDLPRLDFTRKVVTEAMRLYPPADVVGREALSDCEIGGVPVSRGTTVFMSQWVMHHDARFFHEPQKFVPARWTPEFERSLPRFAYFPFGGGPRFCIGQTFAMTEAVLVLASLCQQFAFSPDPTFRLQLWPSITLRPKAGVRLHVAGRGAE